MGTVSHHTTTAYNPSASNLEDVGYTTLELTGLVRPALLVLKASSGYPPDETRCA